MAAANDGSLFCVWTPDVRPVDQEFIDCAIYLYPSKPEADAGESTGGTGFLVSIPSERHADLSHVYAVTNRHVIEGDEDHRIAGACVPRLNTASGRHKALPVEREDWVFHPERDDVAAAYLDSDSLRVFDFETVPVDRFVSEAQVNDPYVALKVGVQCFMVGRFISAEGRQRNTPAVRFGNLSMLPSEPLETRYKTDQEGFLVEMHSMGGYSGSPVFLHVLPYSSGGTKLLGVDWGHLPMPLPLQKDGADFYRGVYVDANSGLSTVVPAWKVRELLEHPKLVARREAADMRLALP